MDASVSIVMVAFTAFLGQLTTSMLGELIGGAMQQNSTEIAIPSPPPSMEADSMCNSISEPEENCNWSCDGAAFNINEYNETTKECFEECFSQVSMHYHAYNHE